MSYFANTSQDTFDINFEALGHEHQQHGAKGDSDPGVVSSEPECHFTTAPEAQGLQDRDKTCVIGAFSVAIGSGAFGLA